MEGRLATEPIKHGDCKGTPRVMVWEESDGRLAPVKQTAYLYLPGAEQVGAGKAAIARCPVMAQEPRIHIGGASTRICSKHCSLLPIGETLTNTSVLTELICS